MLAGVLPRLADRIGPASALPCGSCITIFFLLICILPELFQNGRAALAAGMAHKINNPLAGTDYDRKKKYDFRSYFIKISVYRKTG